MLDKNIMYIGSVVFAPYEGKAVGITSGCSHSLRRLHNFLIEQSAKERSCLAGQYTLTITQYDSTSKALTSAIEEIYT